MFVSAIERSAKFTRPIFTITRNYGSDIIQPGAATLFFVNADGWALTCRHVADLVIAAETVVTKYKSFLNELSALQGRSKTKEKRLVRQLEAKYGYSAASVVEIYNRFHDCAENPVTIQVVMHPTLDLALLKFEGFTKLLCDSFPTFPANSTGLQQGKYLCRLGFPFVEFTNFAYDAATQTIGWTTGKSDSPRFPIEGMVTRLVSDGGGIVGFELSTPGLRGQSGGPAFDVDGRVWGVQSTTIHLDLDFDVDQEVIRSGARKRVRDSSFLHVGRCVHIDIVKAFMKQNNVMFHEE